ncbi:MAG: hypothetical protein FJ087_07115 [Deltaproteobacteria bacterium]|nr:hypothetical protein [Deltaproteobacteria bacterium]
MTGLRTALALLLTFVLVSTGARLGPASECCGETAGDCESDDASQPASQSVQGGCLDDQCFCPCKVFRLDAVPEMRVCSLQIVADARCPAPPLTPGHTPRVFEPPRAPIS